VRFFTSLVVRRRTSLPVTDPFLRSLPVTDRFFRSLPVSDAFLTSWPVIFTAAYDVPPSATINASSDVTLAKLRRGRSRDRRRVLADREPTR
jgi:hypothetical protein